MKVIRKYGGQPACTCWAIYNDNNEMVGLLGTPAGLMVNSSLKMDVHIYDESLQGSVARQFFAMQYPHVVFELDLIVHGPWTGPVLGHCKDSGVIYEIGSGETYEILKAIQSGAFQIVNGAIRGTFRLTQHGDRVYLSPHIC